MQHFVHRRQAHFSRCGLYRYALWRWWGQGQDYALIIGLNPSTDPAGQDNPTVRRCVRFAQQWGYSGVCVANLFAWRTVEPAALLAAQAPIGPRNDHWLRRLGPGAAVIVAAWGNHGQHLGRGQAVRRLLPDMQVLRLNRSGEPAHPLYLPAHLRPQPWGD
ncbi:DUF1643 domain-containing protein [Alcanivorax quisquiliarum]|uniref:DUF1643 domain-containing protein n=1 Tax=Alcanivorax quisquiliarum TaxID=2933565 RepID=A0ABT0E9U8_9GAMM|nr:DUF1643 domain-containing protein [Alcanivorax quisquiliarum]MCK0538598.1 DUF1643 domain-containing protein [Alcanivorax quisquiliarum]